MKRLVARILFVPVVVVPFVARVGSHAEGGQDSAGVAIAHDPVTCLVADKFPRLDAGFAPAERVARARAHFRVAGGTNWYSVEMKPAGGTFSTVLPKPRRQTTRVEYYLEVLDRQFAPSRTAEYAADVVDGPGACSNKVMAAVSGSAKVVVSAPAGAPPMPEGFSTSGVTTAVAGAATGAAVAGTAVAGAAATGGGIGTTALVVGGVAAAGGVAVAVASGSSNSSAAAPTATPTPAASCTPSASQVDFTMTFAFSGTASCGNTNAQQTYRLTNNSPCAVQARSISRAQTFVCAGTPGSFNETLPVQTSTVAPNSGAIIRTGAAAGTRSQGFCCPQEASACTVACSINETYTVDTNAGPKSLSHSYVMDPSLAPCPRCPCAPGQSCGDPNGGHAWIPLALPGVTRTAGDWPGPVVPAACAPPVASWSLVR